MARTTAARATAPQDSSTTETTTEQLATEQLYWNADKTKLVKFNDPEALTLAVNPGNPIPEIPTVEATNVGVVAVATLGSHPDQVESLVVDTGAHALEIQTNEA